jgi:formate hydrogenlyase transcriptional activator
LAVDGVSTSGKKPWKTTSLCKIPPERGVPAYPIPANDDERVAALQAYAALGAPPEPDFDDLVRFMSRLLDVPMAALTLVDTDRQWLLAETGLGVVETPREHAFCAHTIMGGDIFAVSDARADDRFRTNPLVTGPPGLRFYAGAPLVDANGFALGALCVMDRVPRQLNASQEDMLRALSRQAVRSLTGRKARLDLEARSRDEAHTTAQLHAREEFLTRLIECSPDCIKVLDLDGHLVSMNAGGMRTLELCDFNSVRGSNWVDFWQGEDREAALRAVDQARRGGVGRFLGYFPTVETKTPMWFDVVVNAILDEGGRPNQLLALSRDATEKTLHEQSLKDALAEIERLKAKLQTENAYLKEEIDSHYQPDDMIGTSPAFTTLTKHVRDVAPTDATVLILGETGTGKELVARAIHDASRRRQRPLVKVNCGAIAAGLVESELFGHVKGAFTGALANRDGRFKVADGGTIFLDEVGELQLDNQVKLLRVLQEQEFEPIGSSRTIKVNVRVIAATNRDLEADVRAGRFRSDLYFRLNVFPIHVPALRDRSSDIPALASAFVRRFARRMGKRIDDIPPDVTEWLRGYAWPGNIRELQNLLERAVILTPSNRLRLDMDVPPPVVPDVPTTADEPGPRQPWDGHGEQAASLVVMERQHIESVLRQTNWIVEGPRGAAAILNVHPNTLRGRIQRLGIKRPSRD